MRGFLLDENLPRRLRVRPGLPVVHAEVLGAGASDGRVWDYARENGLAIVSKDADFSARILMASPPPWVVHLRFGNLRLSAFHAMIDKAWPTVESLLPANKLVCVYADRVEAFRE